MPLWETNNCAITLAAAVQSPPQFVDFIDDINKLYQQKQQSASLFLSFSCIFTFVLLYLMLLCDLSFGFPNCWWRPPLIVATGTIDIMDSGDESREYDDLIVLSFYSCKHLVVIRAQERSEGGVAWECQFGPRHSLANSSRKNKSLGEMQMIFSGKQDAESVFRESSVWISCSIEPGLKTTRVKGENDFKCLYFFNKKKIPTGTEMTSLIWAVESEGRSVFEKAKKVKGKFLK